MATGMPTPGDAINPKPPGFSGTALKPITAAGTGWTYFDLSGHVGAYVSIWALVDSDADEYVWACMVESSSVTPGIAASGSSPFDPAADQAFPYATKQEHQVGTVRPTRKFLAVATPTTAGDVEVKVS